MAVEIPQNKEISKGGEKLNLLSIEEEQIGGV